MNNKTFAEMMAEAIEINEVMNEIVIGFRNTVMIVEELEQLADVSDKEVAQEVGAMYMIILEGTLAKLNGLLGIIYELGDAELLQLLGKEVREVTEGKAHYIAVALMLTGSDLGGIL